MVPRKLNIYQIICLAIVLSLLQSSGESDLIRISIDCVHAYTFYIDIQFIVWMISWSSMRDRYIGITNV